MRRGKRKSALRPMNWDLLSAYDNKKKHFRIIYLISPTNGKIVGVIKYRRLRVKLHFSDLNKENIGIVG